MRIEGASDGPRESDLSSAVRGLPEREVRSYDGATQGRQAVGNNAGIRTTIPLSQAPAPAVPARGASAGSAVGAALGHVEVGHLGTLPLPKVEVLQVDSAVVTARRGAELAPVIDLAALAKHASGLPKRRRATQLNLVAKDEPNAAPKLSDVPSPTDVILAWNVLGEYSRGGMGIIYEVAHVETRKRGVLKILKPELRCHDIHVQRMLAEGRIMQLCSKNPCLPRCHEVGQHERFGPFVIMDMLDGSTLRDVIRNENAKGRALPIETGVNIVIAIAEAMQAMHEMGVIHRDLKPENIFLIRHGDGSWDVKILDWGAAKHAQLSPHSTHVDPVATPVYMAPEQASRDRHVTVAADIYTLVFILLELVWEHPFADVIASGKGLLAIINMHVTQPLPLPPAHVVPHELARIALRGAAKNPHDRYATMTDLADALRSFLATSWKLEAAPPQQKAPFRPTVLNDRALNAGKTAPAIRKTPPMPKQPPAPARRVATTDVVDAPTLMVLAPESMRGQRFELGSEGVIGANSGICRVVLDHPSISNAHLAYSCVQPHASHVLYSIEALSPTNPAFLEDAAFEIAPWTPNQVLELGDVALCLLPPGSVGTDLKHVPLPAPAEGKAGGSAGERVPPVQARRPAELVPELASCSEPSLVVLGPERVHGHRIRLSDWALRTATIGRSPDRAQVVFDDPTVGERHANYFLGEGPDYLLEIIDLETGHGTFVIRRSPRSPGASPTSPSLEPVIPRVATRVKPFDTVRFGEISCLYLPPGRPVFEHGQKGWRRPEDEPEAIAGRERDEAIRRERQAAFERRISAPDPVEVAPSTVKMAEPSPRGEPASSRPPPPGWGSVMHLPTMSIIVGAFLVALYFGVRWFLAYGAAR